MDSDDYTLGTFKRSKKLMGTPKKEKKEGVDKIDNLTEMIRELMSDIKEIKQDQKRYQQELKELRKENEVLKEENKIIRKNMRSMELKMSRLEKDNVRNNIVISGMSFEANSQPDLKMGVELFMERSMDTKVQIKDVIKMGATVYKIELGNTGDKETVMKNKSKLRNLRERVYINNDLTKDEREIQRKLKHIAENERKNGKRVKMGYQKLIIEGREYKWDIEEEKLKEQTKNTTTIKSKN